MSKGRPRLPEGEKLVHCTIRLPQHLLHHCREKGNVSAVVRRALEDYFEPHLL